MQGMVSYTVFPSLQAFMRGDDPYRSGASRNWWLGDGGMGEWEQYMT